MVHTQDTFWVLLCATFLHPCIWLTVFCYIPRTSRLTGQHSAWYAMFNVTHFHIVYYKEQCPLTRNPPLGLVTSVLPMVMLSLTSRKLGTVVFSKKDIDEWINRVRQTESNTEEEQLDKSLFFTFPQEESRSNASLTSACPERCNNRSHMVKYSLFRYFNTLPFNVKILFADEQ